MLKLISLRTKLLIFFLIAGIVPFTIIGLISLIVINTALSNQAFEKLEGFRNIKKVHVERFFAENEKNMGVLMETVATLKYTAFEKLRTAQEMKKAQIEEYFQESLSDIKVISQNITITEALDSFASTFNPDGTFNESMYRFLEEERYGHSLKQYKEEYGYYDLLLVTKDGNIVYTLNKESDLGQNLLIGELEKSGIYKCFENSLKGIAIQDFEPYLPSDNQYICFIGAPILKYEEVVGVIIIKLSNDPLNTIVQRRKGMGESSETYIVGKQGNKTTYRSDRNVKQGKIGDEKSDKDINNALSGEAGTMIKTDEFGVMRLSAYDPLEIPGLNWSIITTMDLEEVITPTREGEEEDYFTKYLRQYRYHDLFLIHPDGEIFYSVKHEADYNTNIISGKYADSGLGKLIKKVLQTKSLEFADVELYVPSNEIPAAFIAQPLIYNGEVELIVALQLTIDVINEVMKDRTGMGKTGETYLIGSDMLMRSDSCLDPKNYSVKASFKNPEKHRIDTEAARESLDGKTGRQIIKDYRGKEVLSAYTPLDVWGTTWALIAEMDAEEALVSVKILKNRMNIVAILSVCAIIALALLFAKYLVRPINKVINGLMDSAYQVAFAADEVSEISQSQSQNASEQAAAVEESSASLEQMSAMSYETSELTLGVEQLMNQNIEKSGQSLKALVELTQEIAYVEKDSSQMGHIIKSIDDIAFQTNLLALNAAIEAARAGEYGAGFAVVADEVRNLALRATEAAKNTQKLLNSTAQRISQAAQAIKNVNNDFENIIESATVMGEKTNAITEASKELAKGITQNSVASNEIDRTAQRIAANSEESAAAAEELSAQATIMKNFVDELTELIRGTVKKTEAHITKSLASIPSEVNDNKSIFSNKKPKDKKPNKNQETEIVNHEQLIPFDLDDDDFTEF